MSFLHTIISISLVITLAGGSVVFPPAAFPSPLASWLFPKLNSSLSRYPPSCTSLCPSTLPGETAIRTSLIDGCTDVLSYILSSPEVDVNLAAGSDGASALHLAASSGQAESINLLLAASANPNALTSAGLRPADLIPSIPKSADIRIIFNGGESDPDPTPALPDINVGVYGSDEFRMYGFKIKPCSRAYTHDWTECPFAHPGENARRRDPLKHQYSCVPCPEFKKGSCRKGDACEYAHGVFESWLHPAQYRTRLCKDETGCNRKVCFFAHRKDELRPVFASTGSAIDSMDSNSNSKSPSSSPGSPKWPAAGAGKVNCSTPPPNLQLGGGLSRLRSSSNARDVDLEMELFMLESQMSQRKLIDEVYGRAASNSMSPMGLNHIRSSYPASAAMSPSRKLSPSELDRSPKSVAAAMLNSRAAAAFAIRSQSFIDRGSMGAPLGGGGGYMSNGSAGFAPSWGSGGGRADWSVQEGDLSKLRRSASFGQRGGNPRGAYGGPVREPDVSWVSSLVKEPPCSPWVDQMYIEQEQMQMVA